jgi:hypothetical protein
LPGATRDDILAELRRLGLLGGEGDACGHRPDLEQIRRRREDEARERQRRVANALDLWGECYPAGWPPSGREKRPGGGADLSIGRQQNDRDSRPSPQATPPPEPAADSAGHGAPRAAEAAMSSTASLKPETRRQQLHRLLIEVVRVGMGGTA